MSVTIDFSALFPHPPQTIAVAVSGGADSIALAHLLQEWGKSRIIAVTVDHALRDDSATEAQQVHEWLTSAGMEHHILTSTLPRPTSNVMEYARKLRYQLLADFCHQQHIHHLAVAHHLDDQAETFLLRLARGSGVDGLAAMSPLTTLHGITLLRPLLDIPKADLITYLLSRDIPWVEDPTNHNPRYARSRLREALASYFNPEEQVLIPKRIALAARNMQRAREALQAYTEQAMAECVEWQEPALTAQLALEPYSFYPEEIRLRLLEELLARIGCAESPVRFEKLERLHRMLMQRAPHAATLAGCKITLKKGLACIQPEPTK